MHEKYALVYGFGDWSRVTSIVLTCTASAQTPGPFLFDHFRQSQANRQRRLVGYQLYSSLRTLHTCRECPTLCLLTCIGDHGGVPPSSFLCLKNRPTSGPSLPFHITLASHYNSTGSPASAPNTRPYVFELVRHNSHDVQSERS